MTRDKDLLGYHDVRVGNEPDERLTKFIREHLPNLVEGAKGTFEKFSPAHLAYGSGAINYTEWVKLILISTGIWKKRNEEAEPEEGYEEYPEPPDYGEW